tara:strand:- start:444 stop:1136 length:693 start_codon:yes stop_codon:yes gene_type:complete
MSVSGGPDIIQNGLVMYWDAGNPRSYPSTGTAWTDVSNNSATGTLTNNPTFSASNLGILVFNGSNQYVNSSFSFSPTTFTMGVWFKTNATVSAANIYVPMSKEGTNSGFGLNILGSNFGNFNSQLEFFIGNGTGVNTVRYNTEAIVQDRWYNIMASYNETLLRLYVNGIFVNNAVCSTISYSVNAFNVARSVQFGRYLNGSVSSAQLYNTVLNDIEIFQNFNAQRSRFGI